MAWIVRDVLSAAPVHASNWGRATRTKPQGVIIHTDWASSSMVHWTASQGKPLVLVNVAMRPFFNRLQSALRGDPKRAFPVEPKLIDTALAQPVGG